MERKTLSSNHFTSLIVKRRLISLCGILLIVSIIFASNHIEVSADAQNNLTTQKDVTLKVIILSLNVIFLFALLANTLSIIKHEDNNLNAKLQ